MGGIAVPFWFVDRKSASPTASAREHEDDAYRNDDAADDGAEPDGVLDGGNNLERTGLGDRVVSGEKRDPLPTQEYHAQNHKDQTNDHKRFHFRSLSYCAV
jgi:hypothetical protein